MAWFLIDGFGLDERWDLTSADLTRIPDDNGGGYRARLEVNGRWIESMNRRGWFEAAEGAVRQAWWMVHQEES